MHKVKNWKMLQRIFSNIA